MNSNIWNYNYMFNRKTHWQNIYKEKNPLEVSWYQKKPNLSLDLIRKTGVSSNDAIIDVGGGSSILVDYLLKEGFKNLSVLDISENSLASARERLGDDANSIEWIETDITEFKPLQKFSVWHDRAVFHFLTGKSDRKKYVEVLKEGLHSGGYLVIAAFSIGGPKKCSGLDIVQYDAIKLFAELGNNFELVEEKKEIHVTPTNKKQNFTYFLFVRI